MERFRTALMLLLTALVTAGSPLALVQACGQNTCGDACHAEPSVHETGPSTDCGDCHTDEHRTGFAALALHAPLDAPAAPAHCPNCTSHQRPAQQTATAERTAPKAAIIVRTLEALAEPGIPRQAGHAPAPAPASPGHSPPLHVLKCSFLI